MTSIKDISLQEFIHLPEGNEYDGYMDILKPVNLFCKGVFDTGSLTFDEHHTMISILNNPTTDTVEELFTHVFNIKRRGFYSSRRRLLNESVFTFFRARTFLLNHINTMREYENKLFYVKPDEKLDIIGANEKLAPWGTLLPKIKLGKMFGKFPSEVGKLPYMEVIHILAANKDVEELENQYKALK